MHLQFQSPDFISNKPIHPPGAVWQKSILCMTVSILLLGSRLGAQPIDVPVGFPKKIAEINDILILPVDFDCFFLTAGGIREYNHAMSVVSRNLIIESVSKRLSKRSFSVSTLAENSYMEKSWVKLQHFYSVLNQAILNNVYSSAPFPNAVANFSYSLPPLPDSLLYPTTDAVLFIDGFDDCATPRRLGNKTAAAVVSVISVATILVTGTGVIVSVPPDQTFATCALVNRQGEIIWYYRYLKSGNVNMSSPEDVTMFFSKLLRKLKKDPPLP